MSGSRSHRVVHVERPALLDEIHPSGSSVVEASAGTGKTYALEHIVAHAVLSGTSIEDILVITYTEKAAAELELRIRRMFERLRRAWDEGTEPGPSDAARRSWALTAEAIRRVDEARLATTRASISTVHGFCHTVLREHAFRCGIPFERELQPEERLFDAAFSAVLRRRVVDDPSLQAWLFRWTQHRSIDALADLVRGVWARGAEPAPTLDADALTRALERAASLPVAALGRAIRGSTLAPATKGALQKRLSDLTRAAARYAETCDLSEAVDALGGTPDRWRYLVERLDPSWPDAEAWRDVATSVEQNVVPWEAAVLQVVLPHLKEEISRVRTERGWMTFSDMVDDLDRALAGPAGELLATELRSRWKIALVDEFQDTDPAQWRILDRLFGQSARHRLVLVGDPKQAIYGFRGADVHTYLHATETELQRGARRVRLGRCYRSTPRLVRALNHVFEPSETEASFFTGAVHLEAPLIPGRPNLTGLHVAGAEMPPVHLLTWPSEEPIEPRAATRQTLARGVAEHLASLLAPDVLVDGRPLRGGDIFVLTRTTREARVVTGALRRRGLAAHRPERGGWADGAEARDVLAVLAALEDPSDPGRALAAFETPFFGVPPDELDRCRHLPPGHPLTERLFRWARAAEQRRWAELRSELMDEASTVERFATDPDLSPRRPVYAAILDAVLRFADPARASVADVVRWLSDRATSASDPSAGPDAVDASPDAIRVLTMHGAKGLEAEVVVVFGALFDNPQRLTPYRGPVGWCVHIGSDPPADAVRQHREEEERLLYVALTRPRRQLILPHFPDVGGLDGPYAQLDRVLARWRGTEDFAESPLRTDGRSPGPEAAPAGSGPGERATNPGSGGRGQADGRPTADPRRRPTADPGRPPTADAELLRWASERAGDELTSYTALKRRRRSALDLEDLGLDDRAPVDLDESAMPGGARIGKCLHALLETIDLSRVRDGAAPEDAARLAAEPWMERQLRRFDVAFELAVPLGELVVQTLTRPLPFEPNAVRRLVDARPFAREVDFLFSVPAPTPTVVRGFIDALLGFDDAWWVLDYKSDILPSYAPPALEEHVAKHYALQADLYAHAVRGWLASQRSPRRLAGVAFQFVRAPLGEEGEGLFVVPAARSNPDAVPRLFRGDEEDA